MTQLLKHTRIVYPAPRGAKWPIGCSCGWKGNLSLTVRSIRNFRDAEPELNRLFVEHLPEDDRETYVLVDQRQIPDPDDLREELLEGEGRTIARGNWIMPIGMKCLMERWYEAEDGTNIAVLSDGRELPVGEIRTASGQVFKLE